MLDPFAGSGTTALRPLFGRRYIAIEKEARYHRIAEERLKLRGKHDTLAKPLLFSKIVPMENDIKKHIEEQTEKLAAMVAEGFASTAMKQEVGDLRTQMNERFDKVEVSLDKKYQEIDVLRDRMRLLETRVDNLEAVRG